MPRLVPSSDSVVDAAANLWDMSPLGSGLADRAPTPTYVIDVGPQRTVHRYRPTRRRRWHAPVLLVPPLAARRERAPAPAARAA